MNNGNCQAVAGIEDCGAIQLFIYPAGATVHVGDNIMPADVVSAKAPYSFTITPAAPGTTQEVVVGYNEGIGQLFSDVAIPTDGELFYTPSMHEAEVATLTVDGKTYDGHDVSIYTEGDPDVWIITPVR
jgi:hypothetical protein